MRVGEIERREARSNNVQEAVHMQLNYAASTFGLDGFTVASEGGDLFATSTHSVSGHEISDIVAAFSPMLSDDRATSARAKLASRWLDEELSEVGIGWEANDITVREFHAGEVRYFLSAIGGDGSEREVGIYRAILGIRRICAQASL